jgi:hypothetical protein
MTASTQAPPLPRPVSLYEGQQGELYLRRDEQAYPVYGNWPERAAALNGQGSLFALDARAWSENPPPPNDIARQLGLMLDASAISTDAPNQYRRLATWHPDGRVELHRRDLRKGSYAYLGDAVPAFRAKQPASMAVESTAAVPMRAPSTPDQATPYDGFPKGYQRQPEVEVRIAFDVLLGLYRENNTTILGEGGWMLAATDSAGVFLTSWGKGTGDVPAAVWHLAAEAAHRHHLDKHGSL